MDLPSNWESLEGDEYIDNDFNGDFVQVWGKHSGSGDYDEIVAVYVHYMQKYGQAGVIYHIENPVMGTTIKDSLVNLFSSSDTERPELSTQEESSETTVTKTDISVESPEEAREKAVQIMD